MFKNVAISPTHKDWSTCVERPRALYHRNNDIRSPFARDYNRLLHCTAYRRLKHKTQVFFATTNDHICTRIEHVNHVNAVSYTIAKHMGLNTELTNAIAIGHDVGHPPFGHTGELIIKDIFNRELNESFWHEKNSLRFVDNLETLEDPNGQHYNLNLSYAVRDGIICHCGEVNETAIMPRSDAIPLESIDRPSQYSPFTWEGCIVKIADKIAYLGRDIEDARTLNLLSFSEYRELSKTVRPYIKCKLKELSNTYIMHELIIDLCKCSSPEKGITLSHDKLSFINALKDYNYNYIYKHWKINCYQEYAELIINTIFRMLKRFYNAKNTFAEIKQYSSSFPLLTRFFYEWLEKYAKVEKRQKKYKNIVLYNMEDERDYISSIIDFISGMTDSFAIKIFNEITTF